ncbi:hypothetical protein BH09SUM1_BH09SUM1_13210 [soil metagenome]
MQNAFVSRAHPAFARPGVISALGLVIGHLLAAAISLDRWPLAAAMAAFCGAAMVALHRRQPGFTFAFLFLFMSLGAAQEAFLLSQTRAGQYGLLALPQAAESYAHITGEVRELPSRNKGGWTVQMRPGALLECGGVSVTLAAPTVLSIPMQESEAGGGLELLVPGDTVIAIGSVLELPDASSGEPGSWLASSGAVAALRCRQWRVDKSDSIISTAARWVRGLSVESERRMSAMLPGENGALMIAMTVGDTHLLSRDQQEAFSRTGLVHLFSVSGIHTMLIGILLRLMLKPFGFRPWIRLLILAIMLFFFSAFVGMRPSVLRSALLLLIYDSTDLLRRPVEPLSALGSVGTFLLLISPRAVWQVDFQMTFLCVVALIFFSPWRTALQRAVGVRLGWGFVSSMVNGLLGIFFTSIAVQLFLIPILMSRFGETSIVAPFANMAFLFVASLCVICGFAALLLEACVPFLGNLLLLATTPLLTYLNGGTDLMASYPFATWPGVAPSLFASVLLYVALISGAWNWSQREVQPRRSRWTFAPGLGVLLIALFVQQLQVRSGRLDIWFLDVGQGDAILIRSPDGGSGLVDAGPVSAGWLLPDMLRMRGVRRLNFVVATHADADHIGGMPDVFARVPVGVVYTNGRIAETDEFRDFDASAKGSGAREVQARRGDLIQMDGVVKIEALHPTAEFASQNPAENNSSVVLMLEYAGRRILLTGDAERPAETQILASESDIHADVLKAGHHGSGGSTSPEFLGAVNPDAVIISCGRANRYGHPAPELIERVQQQGALIMRTDLQGTIHLSVASNGSLTISKSRGLPAEAN